MIKIGGYVCKEMLKSDIIDNPEVIYTETKENPFVPLISNNICVISTKFLREIMESHEKSKNSSYITNVESLDKWKFSRDFFIDEDWTEI